MPLNEREIATTSVNLGAKYRRFKEALEILEYIKACPENFLENLDCGLCAEEELIYQVLEEFAEWDSLRMSEWREQRNGI